MHLAPSKVHPQLLRMYLRWRLLPCSLPACQVNSDPIHCYGVRVTSQFRAQISSPLCLLIRSAARRHSVSDYYEKLKQKERKNIVEKKRRRKNV